MARYYVQPEREKVVYGPYSLASAKDFARIASQHGRPRLVLRGIEAPVKVRKYSGGERVWPKKQSQLAGLLPAEVPRTIREGSMAKAKKTTTTLRWKKGVKHPRTRKAVGGKVMSKLERKLFKTDGTTRKGVGPVTVKKAYEEIRKGKASKKKPAKRKAAAPRKRRTAARKPKRNAPKKAPARKKAKAKPKTKAKSTLTRVGGTLEPKGYKPQHGKYVVTDGAGTILAGAKKLNVARAKAKYFMDRMPKAAIHIVKMG